MAFVNLPRSCQYIYGIYKKSHIIKECVKIVELSYENWHSVKSVDRKLNNIYR